MDENRIWETSITYPSSNAPHKENNRSKEEIQTDKETSAWSLCHVFSVLTVCVVFLVPVTLIPRTNSIFYQSHWYEFNFVIMVFILLPTANEALTMATYFKEKSFFSFGMLLKMYGFLVMTWTVPYLIAYFIWCQYLNYNWPIPFLGYNYFFFIVARLSVIWTLVPCDLRSNEYFRNNFKLYTHTIIISLVFVILREALSIVFKALPGSLQWIVAFLIPMLKHFETLVLSRLVNRMTGGQEDASQFWLGLNINSRYCFFIAVRLPSAEIITACFIIAIDFLLQLKMTYKIVQLHNIVNDKNIENICIEKQRTVTKLTLAELTEGMAPIVYAVGFSMAYYGYNGTILGNVKNGYWAFKSVDDIDYLFQMMLILFGVDTLSVLVNSFILATFTNVSLFKEFCRMMKTYWHFIAVKFAMSMMIMFVTKDINLGMDSTGKWDWITNDGRINLINNSIDLSYEEKSQLLNASVLSL